MKKLTKILAICMLISFVIMTFASCSLLGMDLEATSIKLEEAGYDVYYAEDYSNTSDMNIADLGIILGVAYVLDELGIDKEPVSILVTMDDDEGFWAFEFEDNDDASDAYEDLQENWDEYSKDSKSKSTYGKSGNVVFFGTVQGVKDAIGFPNSLLVFEK